MKLLVIAPYFPFPPNSGGAIRVYNIIRQLGQRHQIFFAYPQVSNISPEFEAQAREICTELIPFPAKLPVSKSFNLRRFRAWRSFSSLRPLILKDIALDVEAACKAIIEKLGDQKPDLIHIHQFHCVEVGVRLKEHYRVKLLLDEQNVEPQIWQQMASSASRPDRKLVFSWEAFKLRRSLRRFYPLSDTVTAVSTEDSAALRLLTGRKEIPVVPNGVDTEYFRRNEAIVPNSDQILFTGTLGYEPNLDGLLYFYREIWPRIQAERPQTCLMIVGRAAPPDISNLDNGSTVRVVSSVPDMRPYYEKARVCIVPLRWGGGTRLKVLEALAMQVPIVSTSVGVSGLNLKLGDHYLRGDSPESFANLTLRLLDIKGPARHLAKAGRQLVENCYDWSKIVVEIEKIYQDLRG